MEILNLIKEFNNQLSSLIILEENGEETNPIETAAKIKLELDTTQELFKEYKKIGSKEFYNNGGTKIEIDDIIIKPHKGKKTYTYTNNPRWAKIKQKLTIVETELKQAVALYEKGKVVADENGEEIILPTVSYADDTFSVSRKK